MNNYNESNDFFTPKKDDTNQNDLFTTPGGPSFQSPWPSNFLTPLPNTSPSNLETFLKGVGDVADQQQLQQLQQLQQKQLQNQHQKGQKEFEQIQQTPTGFSKLYTEIQRSPFDMRKVVDEDDTELLERLDKLDPNELAQLVIETEQRWEYLNNLESIEMARAISLGIYPAK